MTTGLGLLLAVLLHPVHETVAEVEWNSETGRLEVALRLSVLDEQWIGRQAGSKESVEVWAKKYLQSRFRIDPNAGDDAKKRSAKYHWVGRQQQGSHVWWYFEIEPREQQRPSVISQKMLFDRNEGYVNRVVLLTKKTRRAVTLTAEKPQAKLVFEG